MRDRIRAVVFDLDGVLLDTESINVRAAFEAFAAAGHPLDPDDAHDIVGRHPIDYGPELARRHGVPTSVLRTIQRDQGERYGRLWREEARLMDGAVDALREARDRSLRVGLATSSGRDGVEVALDRFGIRTFFDATLTKDDVSARKPDPQIYLLASKRLSIPAEAMLVVEDSAHGVRAAKAAGAPCVAVRTPHTPPEAIASADAVIASLRDLAAFF